MADSLRTRASKSFYHIKQYLAPTRPYWQPLPTSSPQEYFDEKIAHEKDSEFPFPQQAQSVTSKSRPSLWLALITAFSVLYIFFRHAPGDASDSLPVKPTFMYVAVPTTSTEQNTDLCKTIVTAQVLGYPIPNVIPYGKSHNTTLPSSELPISRLANIHSWLSSLPPQSDDGIVVLLDNPSTWFQLRPHVLLSRYYAINKQANKRLSGAFKGQVEQTVIFPTQRKCQSSSDDPAQLSCNPSNDMVSWGNPTPGYLGQGSIIGPVKVIRSVLARAMTKMNVTQSLTPTMAFDQIFSEQQAHRDDVRSRKKQIDQATENLEFGIGLDYDGELSYSAVNGADSVAWGTVGSLPSDIATSMTPFWTPSGTEPDIPHTATWTDISLLSVKRGVVPPMIHLTPAASEAEDLTEVWWPQLWITEHARTLYTAAERMPASIVATLTDNVGRERAFWNSAPIVEKNGAVVYGEGYREYAALCSTEAVAKEVWRDGKGVWKDVDYGRKLADLFH